MIRTLTILILLIAPLYTLAGSFYTVNLAIYKEIKEINQTLSNFSPALRDTIVIEKDKHIYRVRTVLTKKRSLLTTLLPHYKKVFPHASIVTTFFPRRPTHSKHASTEKSAKDEENFYALLKDKTFYLAPVLRSSKDKKYLIKVVFGNTQVSYTPILGDIPPMTALYKVEGNRLFLYQKGLFNPNIYSLLEESRFKYHLISSWVGNKRINYLRYYLNLHDAKAYINLR